MKKLLILTMIGVVGWGCLPARQPAEQQPGDSAAVGVAPDDDEVKGSIPAYVSYTREDSQFVCRVLKEAKKTKETETLFFARKFLNQPYVAHTLEVFDEERLVINTRELDCTTLVENVLALTICARQGKTSFADFVKTLQQMRYRNGVLDGYTSRLHYFSDWIVDNGRMGIVTEIQGPNPPFTAMQKLSINYMSKHPASYKALKAHPEMVPTIREQEMELTGREFPFIPKQEIRKQNTRTMRNAVKDGDVIAITTKIEGLDIAHLGFAVWKADGLHLLNASMVHKKVEEDPVLFRDYIMQRSTFTGIRLVRLN